MRDLAAHEVPPDSAATITGVGWSSQGRHDLDDVASDKSVSPQELGESDFNEVALDDDVRFSAVPLTAREVPARKSFFEKIDEFRRRSAESVRASIIIAAGKQAAYKKRLSEVPTGAPQSAPVHLNLLDVKETDSAPEQDAQPTTDEQQQLPEESEDVPNEQLEEEPAVNGTIDWDFWGAVISDYQSFASENGEQLARAIQLGIPDTLRGMMWQLMAASKDPQLEETYLRLLKENSVHEKAITRDLGRTFPHHAFFTDGQGIGQENLFNVLKAYSLYDPAVGYCQGIPFVVAILLLNMPDEEAFSLLVRLMHTYDLRGHFLPEMPKLQLRLYQFDRLLEESLPVLHIHFLRQGVKSSMFCSQWFLTLFSYRFPLNIVFRIYDSCLASGIEAIFGFSIALLKKNEEVLMTLKFDQILAFINTQIFRGYMLDPADEGSDEVTYNVDQFIQDAVELKITPFMLDTYAHEYEEIVRIRDAHANEVAALQQHNRVLQAQTKTLESSLAQINDEHVQVLNELVKARLRNEELEGELVRYKLLYAEAMHEHQDSQSSHRMSAATMQSRRGSDL